MLALSSIIIADNVAVRAVPYPPAEQAAHPYAIGPTEITPAADATFTRDERLAVAFQVINARSSETGKPDLAVNFRIVRAEGDRETPVASLSPQSYTDATMPADFDLRLGHPIFVAVAAPLATLLRGDYRLKIMVSDRIAGTASTADADFRVIGTPLSLLAEAPRARARLPPRNGARAAGAATSARRAEARLTVGGHHARARRGCGRAGSSTCWWKNRSRPPNKASERR